MISFSKEEYSDELLFSLLDKDVSEWMKETFGSFTPPQRRAIPLILKGENVLISSPTGSGKTLSAFLAFISKLVSLAKSQALEDRVYVLYVSPLRALNNDIERSLRWPLSEIEKRAGIEEKIRIGVRTSDRTSHEKQKMLRKPPHILITTPESLAIALSSPKFSKLLENVETVIVDEIHAMAENKRGSHLSLSLERLAEIAGEFQRIGLSATISPLEEVARFLVGMGRSCKIVDTQFLKKKEIIVEFPIGNIWLAKNASEISEKIYDRLVEIIENHRNVLIFTNTRSATERVVYKLKEKTKGKYVIEAHHSSLGREHRLDVEERLKKGEIKVMVSSTSLELGIDIGYIDVVVLLSSPKSVNRALQRIGRSGHKLHEKSKGIIIAVDNDDLVENSVIATKALKGEHDKVRIIFNALDVLAQHVVGMALRKRWSVKEAYQLVRKAYPFHNLPYEDFLSLLKYLAGHYSLEEENVYAKIWFDGEFFGRRGKTTRMIYFLNIGTIPDEAYISVIDVKKRRKVGNVEEEFAERLVKGDIFVLAGKTYVFLYSRGGKIFVQEVEGKNPNIPAWFSEMLPLSYEVARDIERVKAGDYKWLLVDKKIVKHIASYIKMQEKLGFKFSLDEFVVEEYYEDHVYHYIFHTIAGRKANEALARGFAYAVSRMKLTNVGVTYSDYGFVLSVEEDYRLSEKEIKELIMNIGLKECVEKALENSEMVRKRFKDVATIGFLVLRRYGGKAKSLDRQYLNSSFLYHYIKEKYPDFPLLKELKRTMLYDAMHLDEAQDYLAWMRKRKFKLRKGLPSPYSFNLVVMGNKDVITMEDKIAYIRRLYEKLKMLKGIH